MLDRVRRHWPDAAVLWLNLTLVFAALNLVAWGALGWAERGSGGAPPFVRAALARTFPRLDAGQIDELLREHKDSYAVYEPFTGFRPAAVRGRWLNVDPRGFRVSRNQGPWPPDRRDLVVFVFGGSTGFGVNVPDDHTVASYLQAALAASHPGRAVRVYNFARGGFFSSPERILFGQLLLEGAVPQLAVFLDGMNDFFFPDAWIGVEKEGDVVGTESPVRALREDVIRALPVVRARSLFHWRGAPPPRGVVSQPAAVATPPPAIADDGMSARVIARYLANKRLIEGLAEAHAVRPIFVWQPVPTYAYDLRLHAYSGSFGPHERSRQGYPHMTEYVRTHSMGDDFAWCADIQGGSEPLYVDEVHYGPVLAERIAACIAARIGTAP
jgi:hypothetical protein